MNSLLTDVLLTMPQMLVGGLVLGKYIKTRHIWWYAAAFTLLSTMIYAATAYLRTPYWVRGAASLLIQVLFVTALARIPRVHGLIFLMLTNLCMFLTELPSTAMIRLMNPDIHTAADLALSQLLSVKITYFPALVLAYLFPYWICRRFFTTEGCPEVSRFLPFLLVQSIMTALSSVMALKYTDDYVFINIVCSAYLLFGIILDLLLMSTFKKIYRAHVLALQKEQAQSILQAQLDYYNQFQHNAKVIRQLRHDMCNQLRTLSILLEDGEAETAQTMLASLRENVNRTGSHCYTGNPVVDAVVEPKLYVCSESGIALNISGSLPSEIGIKAMSLCSIASNLLDNAIHACQSLPSQQTPEIHFSVSLKDDRVLFSCENSASSDTRITAAEPKLNQEHGYGLSILQSIASEYHGELQLQQQESTVKVILWLTLEPIQEEAAYEPSH